MLVKMLNFFSYEAASPCESIIMQRRYGGRCYEYVNILPWRHPI